MIEQVDTNHEQGYTGPKQHYKPTQPLIDYTEQHQNPYSFQVHTKYSGSWNKSKKCKRIQLLQRMFSAHNGIKLESNEKKVSKYLETK